MPPVWLFQESFVMTLSSTAHNSHRSVLRLLWLFLLPRFTLFRSPFWCRSITLLHRLRAPKPSLGICICGGIRAQAKENFQMTAVLCSWHSVAPSFQQQDRLWSCHHSKPSSLLRVICQVQSPASASVSSVWSSLQETRNRHVQGKEAHEGKRTRLPSPLHGQLHRH